MKHFTIITIAVTLLSCCHGKGMLYPQDSESRESKYLDGIWDFKADFSPTRDKGFIEKWWEKPLKTTGPVIDMPVPSSFNDLTEDKSLRDFVGWVWYDTTFFMSSHWKGKRIVLRFDSAHYNTIVWINGQKLMTHSGGHLPFEGDVHNLVNLKGINRMTVALNNTLTPLTLPPGQIVYQSDTSKYPPGYFTQNLQMDFFNYGGIHRHVRLYTTPWNYIDDITVTTDISGDFGLVKYDIIVSDSMQDANSNIVEIFDAKGKIVAKSSELTGVLMISNPQLWWPYGMNESVGYMYTLHVNASGDFYHLPFGIREVKVLKNSFLINSKKFYCLGVDKHEDSDLRGKGLDPVLLIKDFNMLRWLGVNCIRTSHYPYAEEFMQLADKQGIAVIDESPGVGIIYGSNMGQVSLNHHLDVMGEMVQRDKNHPSVIMWSVANEPASDIQPAVHYFKTVIEHTRKLDPGKRPVTFVSARSFEKDLVVPFVDVICINRYYAWYHNCGHLEVVKLQLHREFEGFWNLYSKPIIMSEYGADTIPGLHREPSFVFTEDYQTEFLLEYHKGFDAARSKYLVGEMVWNFADFMTVQGVTRVVGNKKGLLTRQRQPKASAYVIRERYHTIREGRDTTHVYNKAREYTTHPHIYQHPMS